MRSARLVACVVAVAAGTAGTAACSLLVDDDGLAGTPRSPDDAGTADAAAAVDGNDVDAAAGDSSSKAEDDAAGTTGVVVRGVERATLDSSAFVRLKAPEGTRAGDVLWAVLSTYYNVAVTPPAGFTTVTSTYNSFCTSAGWRISVYVRIATAMEPAEGYGFNYKTATFDWASGVLVALAGKTTATSASTIVQTANVRDHDGNPYASAPLNAATTSGFGILTYMREHGDSSTFTVPQGLTRLAEHGGIAIFGKELAANTSLATASSSVTPESCGFTHAALLDLR